jgi:hypothetical protein
MNVQTFVLGGDGREPDSQLRMEAKRYIDSRHRVRDGFTLVACHGVGQRQPPSKFVINVQPLITRCIIDKEQWEPIIQGLFDAQIHNPRLRIREVWALEWQNHGQSYLLNQDVIHADDEDAARKY